MDENVVRDLRLLHLHFPRYGEGYLFFILRKCNYDRSAALHALADEKKVPYRSFLPKKLSLHEARDILSGSDRRCAILEETVRRSTELVTTEQANKRNRQASSVLVGPNHSGKLATPQDDSSSVSSEAGATNVFSNGHRSNSSSPSCSSTNSSSRSVEQLSETDPVADTDSYGRDSFVVSDAESSLSKTESSGISNSEEQEASVTSNSSRFKENNYVDSAAENVSNNRQVAEIVIKRRTGRLVRRISSGSNSSSEAKVEPYALAPTRDPRRRGVSDRISSNSSSYESADVDDFEGVHSNISLKETDLPSEELSIAKATEKNAFTALPQRDVSFQSDKRRGSAAPSAPDRTKLPFSLFEDYHVAATPSYPLKITASSSSGKPTSEDISLDLSTPLPRPQSPPDNFTASPGRKKSPSSLHHHSLGTSASGGLLFEDAGDLESDKSLDPQDGSNSREQEGQPNRIASFVSNSDNLDRQKRLAQLFIQNKKAENARARTGRSSYAPAPELVIKPEVEAADFPAIGVLSKPARRQVKLLEDEFYGIDGPLMTRDGFRQTSLLDSQSIDHIRPGNRVPSCSTSETNRTPDEVAKSQETNLYSRAFDFFGALPWDDSILPEKYLRERDNEKQGEKGKYFLWWDRKQYYFLPAALTKEIAAASTTFAPFSRNIVFALSSQVYKKLYPYQRESIVWMFELFKRGRGGILGDEMGLGKTVQICAFLRGLLPSRLLSRALILLPLTLLDQWRQHLHLWTRKIEIAVFHGSARERDAALQALKYADGPVVLLTTYETFRNAAKQLASPVYLSSSDDPSSEDSGAPHEKSEKKMWDLIIMDEAHKLRNPRNQVAQAVRLAQARTCLLLSGTPVMNKLEELWALMDVANPGLLGNQRTFKMEFADPIKLGSTREASQYAVAKKNRIAELLYREVRPYILRRTFHVKDQQGREQELSEFPSASSQKTNSDNNTNTRVSDPYRSHDSRNPASSTDRNNPQQLPPKTDIILWLELTPFQRKVYDAVLASREVQDIFHKAHATTKGRNSLVAISRLLTVCRHPLLLLPKEQQAWDPSYRWTPNDHRETKRTDCSKELTYWEELVQSATGHSVEAIIQQSNKLLLLQELLPALHRKGHRVLVFSQSTAMLDLIEFALLKPLDLSFTRIDGKVPGNIRQQRVDMFETKPNIFAMILTTKVGGQGLNLVSADRMIIVDPDWTPANDAQAIGRIHRIGQNKAVVIYRLFTAGAIEDHTLRIQIFKQGLAKVALEDARQKSYFSNRDLKTIFELKPPGDCETRNILAVVDSNVKERVDHLGGLLREELEQDPPLAKISSIYAGLSDYSCLYQGLSTLGAAARDEALADADNAVRKLRAEEYDSSQVLNVDFLRKALAQNSHYRF